VSAAVERSLVAVRARRKKQFRSVAIHEVGTTAAAATAAVVVVVVVVVWS